jgi:hypothetical protein
VAPLAHPVRPGDLGEREGLGDREREAPRLDQRADLAEHVDLSLPKTSFSLVKRRAGTRG